MDPGKVFQIITNSTLLATRLVSSSRGGKVEFSKPLYCAFVREDAPSGSTVVVLSAAHELGGKPVRYSITGGNKDGLFTIDQRSGVVTLAAALDYEIYEKHKLAVAAAVEGEEEEDSGAAPLAMAFVVVQVEDVNDNPPRFVNPEPYFTVIEEDDHQLPVIVTRVEALDLDRQDQGNLLYTLHGDGVDGYSPAEVFFTIHPRTGELVQLRALDRDPPRGKDVWRVRIQVRDGQNSWPFQDDGQDDGQISWPFQDDGQTSWPFQEEDLPPHSRLERDVRGETTRREAETRLRRTPWRDQMKFAQEEGSQREDRIRDRTGDRTRQKNLRQHARKTSLAKDAGSGEPTSERVETVEGLAAGRRPLGREDVDGSAPSAPAAGGVRGRPDKRRGRAEADARCRYYRHVARGARSSPYGPRGPRDPGGGAEGGAECPWPKGFGPAMDGGGGGEGVRRRIGRVHVVETVATFLAKDINDNPPVFPNATMFGEVQENGPIDLSVGVVSAWDADDATEGTNARLTYSIEKNVIHDRTGEAIFTVQPETGLIRTALCCLDRETTPEYHIQVVAVDGGGLKGTGTVVVRLSDVNDNSPRLARPSWHLEVDETWGQRSPPDDEAILEIAAADRDEASNYFHYRVVEESGWGWEHFGMRSKGALGQLFVRRNLDFENEAHRRGFKFMVQVTDRGRGGWRDPRHLAAAWITVRLRDLNDNPPHFRRPHAHAALREDAAPGTLLATLAAHDPDMGGGQEVDYHVVGGWDALAVDGGGGVSLRRSLDREAAHGAEGVALVVGVDRGRPPLSATASLTITVTDVNDCAPSLLPPTLLRVAEGGPPTLVGVLTATDRDVWALGHGPPFNFSLPPTNPAHVLERISLRFDPRLDSGRGGAELWAVGPLDREERGRLLVEVMVADAQGLADTHVVTIVVDDVNDNPMKPASKAVYLWKTQGWGNEAPLGRVYVEDPDDWDLKDKTFRWKAAPHPLFSLNQEDGNLFASSLVRQGRYELQFAVSDALRGQRDVTANVTVTVRVLAADALAHATPVTVTPITPAQLARGWTPQEGGGALGRLLEAVQEAVAGRRGPAAAVEVVSVYALRLPRDPGMTPDDPGTTPDDPLTSTCVWVSASESRGRYVSPVKVMGLLGLHSRQLQERTRLTVAVLETTDGFSVPGRPGFDSKGFQESSSAATSASTALPLQVVDANATSLVTPRPSHAHACHAHEPEACTPTSCLNGGRCLGSGQPKRCVCPEGSEGPLCKVLSRSFHGSGFAWVRRLPPCLPDDVSFRILSRLPDALLLYSGPLAPPQRPRRPSTPLPTPMLAVQLSGGRPQVLLEGAGGGRPLKLEVNATVNDGSWHTIHFHLNAREASLMVDLCGRGWDDRRPRDDDDDDDDAHCATRAAWAPPAAWRAGATPLQVGGLAHAPPRPEDHGWREAPTARPLDGCLSHLTLNGQLVDLGEPAHSRGSAGGCRPQEAACAGGCGRRGRCAGGLERPECECEPGWAGPACAAPTAPVALGRASYARVALSFAPEPRAAQLQLRLRFRGPREGLLLRLAAHQHAGAFSLYLREGVACASAAATATQTATACVEGRPLGDGFWHTVRAERHGRNLVVSVDDGDGGRRNESLLSLLGPPDDDEDDEGDRWPLEEADDDDDDDGGVTVGGMPLFAGDDRPVAVHDDLRDCCVDDLRVSGRPLPLPPSANTTEWGRVTTFGGVTPGCSAPDACANATTCAPPLSCRSAWGQVSCSCGPGRHLVGRSCEDVDECLWRPCLFGGSCRNLQPGFLCSCGPGRTGDHCQWAALAPGGHLLTAPAAAASLALSLLLLVVVGVLLSLRLRLARAPDGRRVGVVEEEANAPEEGGGKGGDRREAEAAALLQRLRHDLRRARPPSRSEKEEDLPRQDALFTSLPQEPPGEPLLPKDDLRAYAYEGDGSPAGSLTSDISGLRREAQQEEEEEKEGEKEEEGLKPIVSEFLEVIDLLRHLPEEEEEEEDLRKKGGSGTL